MQKSSPTQITTHLCPTSATHRETHQNPTSNRRLAAQRVLIDPGLLIAVAPSYRYCSGATFTVAVAVAPLLLAESRGDSSAATFLATFSAIRYRYFKKTNVFRCS